MALTDAQKAKLLKLGQLAKFKAMADTTYQAAISDLSTNNNKIKYSEL